MSASPHPLPAGWLMAYYDGELEADRQALVAAHLAGCGVCRQTLADLGRLRAALAADALPDTASPAEFWGQVQARLPERPPAAVPARVGPRQALRRWWPGIGLLLLNGAVQVLALTLTVLLVGLPLFFMQAPAWVTSLVPFAAGAALGLPGWLLPAGWEGWVLFAAWLLVSAQLALLYLAWLGYELRHGPFVSGRAAAYKGA